MAGTSEPRKSDGRLSAVAAEGLNLELEPLLLRASTIKEPSSMVDTASKLAATPLRSRARALPEISLCTGHAPEKSGVNPCEPTAVR